MNLLRTPHRNVIVFRYHFAKLGADVYLAVGEDDHIPSGWAVVYPDPCQRRLILCRNAFTAFLFAAWIRVSKWRRAVQVMKGQRSL